MPSNDNSKISVKSFVTAIAVIFGLMVLTYILTFIIPSGEYPRYLNSEGNTVIDTSGEFHFLEDHIPFWKWLLSPVLLLGAEGGGTTIAVIVFLLVIGGVFNCLEKQGIMKFMLDLMVAKFGKHRYGLMAGVMLLFMALGAVIGSFEECVPLVPIVVALSIGLGWDALTGVCMSLLAVGCGFASGVCNPFTVGVAQGLAGLPMFSGIWLRLLSFIPIYFLLLFFVRNHAKKIEKPITDDSTIGIIFHKDPALYRALKVFGAIFGVGIVLVFSSSFLTFLQDYTMIIVAVMFLVAGIASSLTAGMNMNKLLYSFEKGVVGVLPAVLMILMAASIKYTMTEAGILDTILYYGVNLTQSLPRWSIILFIYLVVLVLNFFIPSGSAKAFLLIPLLVPMAELFGISAQLVIVAFAFGDGFSNVLYPTNPVLLISLGLADISYGKWFRHTWKFQLMNLVLTSAILLFGLMVGYR